MSPSGGTDEPGAQGMELEYASTVTKGLETSDSKVKLTEQDLKIKKEIVEEDLHPGDAEYYPSLQYVYQNLKKAEKAVEASRKTEKYMENLKRCSSINQIFERMRSAYFHHAEHTGKVLPKGWDTVKLAEPIPVKGVKGMRMMTEEDPDYHPEPISHLDPTTMGLNQIEDYMTMFDAEVGELNKIRETGTVREYTKAKIKRKEELEDKFIEFEIERDNRLAKRGGSKRSGGTEEEEGEDPKGQVQLRSPWDRTKPKKGTYPTVGPNGPGDLNIEGDWEGPIELFEFEDIEEGWTNCTTGYYWHSLLGGGICQFDDEWYRNWEFNYEPPDEEIVREESEDIQQEDLEIPLTPSQKEASLQTLESSQSSEEPKPLTSKKTIQQRAKSLLVPLTPDEEKTRENNIAHIAHLREEMKKLIVKWEEDIKAEKDELVKTLKELNKERLEGWLEDIRVVLNAATLSPIYIPTVREEWIKAVNQKSPPALEDPEDPAKQPKKPADPKPVRKHVARKSSTRQQRSGSKKGDSKDVPQPQAEDPEKQHEGPIGKPDPPHPGEDPEVPQPPEEDPQKQPEGPIDEPVPKNTAGGTSGNKSPWYKTGVTYNTKKTGPVAIPPENLLDVTRKQKAGCQPKPSTSEGPSASKRKRTAPTRWLPHTQPRSTYMMGNKITPVWGLIHKGSMDPTEDWRVAIYQPPKLTEKQRAAQKEDKKQKQRYKRYIPGQLALKEIK